MGQQLRAQARHSAATSCFVPSNAPACAGHELTHLELARLTRDHCPALQQPHHVPPGGIAASPRCHGLSHK